MKNYKFKTLLLGLTLFVSAGANAQLSATDESDSLGVIGDNLNLSAVLDAFKEAENVEAFEKTLNDPEGKLNNLDLNEDDEVDYIQVIDETEGDAHAFILRVDLDETESQDVAVIELEKTSENNAQIQIIGDEEIYGADYILEPQEDQAITKRAFIPQLIVINVWSWRCVRFVYAPTYRPWRSRHHWGNYPKWWRPWRPIAWRTYNHNHRHHHGRFQRVKVRRCVTAHRVFNNHRRTSTRVRHHRNHHANHHRNQHGKQGNQGHGTHGHKTQTKGNKGNIKGQGRKGNAKATKGGNKNVKRDGVKSNSPQGKKTTHQGARTNNNTGTRQGGNHNKTGNKNNVQNRGGQKGQKHAGAKKHGGAKKGSVQKKGGGQKRSGGHKGGASRKGGGRR